MSTIRFVLRTDKADKIGNCPIDLIYQISGKRRYFRSDKKLMEVNWDQKNQNAIYVDRKTAKEKKISIDFNLFPSVKEINSINSDLDEIKRKINRIERRFEEDNIIYNTKMVIDNLRKPKTKEETVSNLLVDFIDKYIIENSPTHKKGSLAVYKSLKNHLISFQKDKRKKIVFENLDYSFFPEFQNYLIDKKGLNNTTVAKKLSNVKTLINYARKHNIIVDEKYKEFKIKQESLDVIALTNEEFEKLFSLDLVKNNRLAQVRDVFCFSCVTGLRYSDLEQLSRANIKQEEIKLTIKKTREVLTIPLNSYSHSILAKYNELYKPLPVISNQKMNLYLKGWDEEIKGSIKHHIGLCELAGINENIEVVRFRGAKREAKVFPKYKLISVHTGRRTFATLSLEKGMSAEEVMTITGHKDYRSFKRYIKITENRKKIVMQRAWGKIQSTSLKVV